MAIIITLFILGWLAVSIIGTQAYFKGEQTKPIHERNWNSDSFDQLAQSITGEKTTYLARVPAYYFDPRTSKFNS